MFSIAITEYYNNIVFFFTISSLFINYSGHGPQDLLNGESF